MGKGEQKNVVGLMHCITNFFVFALLLNLCSLDSETQILSFISKCLALTIAEINFENITEIQISKKNNPKYIS